MKLVYISTKRVENLSIGTMLREWHLSSFRHPINLEELEDRYPSVLYTLVGKTLNRYQQGRVHATDQVFELVQDLCLKFLEEQTLLKYRPDLVKHHPVFAFRGWLARVIKYFVLNKLGDESAGGRFNGVIDEGEPSDETYTSVTFVHHVPDAALDPLQSMIAAEDDRTRLDWEVGEFVAHIAMHCSQRATNLFRTYLGLVTGGIRLSAEEAKELGITVKEGRDYTSSDIMRVLGCSASEFHELKAQIYTMAIHWGMNLESVSGRASA